MEKKDIEIIWAAGFFDGEGCTYATKDKFLVLTIGQKNTNKEVLERFKSAVGVGNIYTYKRESAKTGFFSTYKAHSQEVKFVLELISPYLSSEKINQAKDAIELCTKYAEYKKNFHRCGHKKEGVNCKVCKRISYYRGLRAEVVKLV